ncbi:hypothetical protein [Aeromicrobium sp. 9AM]|uniref:hypothetical protein n=1 Tax=Aeromicrobium sp. 9AM TaxID=2653126 RepID=UPI0012F3D67E|nr:hypothetical protein [Aeromicrobium sp. 9AM]VXC13264.1 conserved hypothetical protein [Aeromicrobium sp. 9AM]
MALLGAIIAAVGAALVLLDVLDRWRTTTNVIDGGNASTDFDAELQKAKRRELAAVVGPLLVLVGAVLTVIAL